MNDKVYKKLIEIAKNKGIIFYSDLNIVCNLGINLEGDVGGKEIGEIIGEVSRFELEHNRPPLSVLVGYKNTKPFTPADSFFNYMDELADELKIEIRKPAEINDMLKIRLMNWCYKYWSEH